MAGDDGNCRDISLPWSTPNRFAGPWSSVLYRDLYAYSLPFIIELALVFRSSQVPVP